MQLVIWLKVKIIVNGGNASFGYIQSIVQYGISDITRDLLLIYIEELNLVYKPTSFK